jgi:hypothetical protein
MPWAFPAIDSIARMARLEEIKHGRVTVVLVTKQTTCLMKEPSNGHGD